MKPHSNRLSFFLLLSILLAGCVSTGRKVDQDKVSQIQKGVTTKAQVHDMLGAPMQVTTDSDGNATWTYTYMHSSAQAQNFIPYFGALVAGADTENQSTIINFNRDGIVSNISSSYGGTSTNTNLASGPKGETPK